MRVKDAAGPRRWQRISPLDASNLRVEKHGLPMTVAVLATVNAAGFLGPDSRVDEEVLRRYVAGRIPTGSRLRQVLLATRWWEGPPAWVDDPAFDISARVRFAPVPPPHDERSLLDTCSRLNAVAMDPSIAPWELWVLPGRDDGTLALLLRLHHVVADGMGAMTLLSVLFDKLPGEAPEHGPLVGEGAATGLGVGPSPSAVELAADNLYRRAAAFPAATRRLLHGARPSLLRCRLAAVVASARLALHAGRAPALSFNRPVGTGRQIHLVRADLAAVKTVAHASGATVNDVLLSACAGGVEGLLRHRGELTPELALHVSVPTSLRHEGDRSAGNQVGVRLMTVPLDGHAGDRVRRADALARLARSTRELKRLPPMQPGGRLLQRWMVHAMPHQRLVNILLSNLAGPTGPVWFDGARVREISQIGGLQGNVPINVGVLSYDGRLGVEVTSDATLVPDIDAFVGGLTDCLCPR